MNRIDEAGYRGGGPGTTDPEEDLHEVATGVTVAMTRKATARLRVEPRLTRVVLIPEAMPLSSGGTEFIIEALFGAAKMPIPLPTNIRGTASSGKVVCGPIWVSSTNPTDETSETDRREEPGPVPVREPAADRAEESERGGGGDEEQRPP